MKDKSALLVIDMQNAMFEQPDPVYKGEDLLQIIHGLICKARDARIPIIYIQHNGRTGGPLWGIVRPNMGVDMNERR